MYLGEQSPLPQKASRESWPEATVFRVLLKSFSRAGQNKYVINNKKINKTSLSDAGSALELKPKEMMTTTYREIGGKEEVVPLKK